MTTSTAASQTLDIDTAWINKRVAEATKRAKAQWGTGWDRLTPEMQNAYICQAVIGLIAAVDFEDAFAGKAVTAEKMMSKLLTITKLCDAAMAAE